MKNVPYLWQRLMSVHEPMSFGDVVKKVNDNPHYSVLENGVISSGYKEIRPKVMEYDYMGSSEFEFGALPAALKALAKSKLATTVKKVLIPDEKNLKDKKQFIGIIHPEGADLSGVWEVLKPWIALAASGKPSSELFYSQRLKELLMYENVFAHNCKQSSPVGWLVVDEEKECFVFVDIEVMRKMMVLLKLPQKDAVDLPKKFQRMQAENI